MQQKWNDNEPIYVQLRNQAIAMILDGVLDEGDPLPSVRNVAADFQLNPITVSKAYQSLVDEDLVERRRGLGMFVRIGAREALLQAERSKFIDREWPEMVRKIIRLGLSAEQLLNQVEKKGIPMAAIVEARNLYKKYRNTLALDNVSFDVQPGRILGLIGPNGAGKTTALKAILGLTSFAGDLTVLGLDPMRNRHRLMQNVCFIADVAVLPRWIRVHQVLDFVAGVHPRFSRAKAKKFLAATKIKPNSRVKELSKGMVAQLHLAVVMAIDARLLVLDEPTLGLDIIYRKEFYSNLLNDYFDEERTIIVTTHQVEEVEHILTDLMFIKDGKIILNATMDAVAERFVEVMVTPDMADEARALKPLHEREVFGKHVFLFDGADALSLAELGELHNPSIADLFVATMKDQAA